MAKLILHAKEHRLIAEGHSASQCFEAVKQDYFLVFGTPMPDRVAREIVDSHFITHITGNEALTLISVGAVHWVL